MLRRAGGQIGRSGAALLLCAFCFPSTARAACGDHVVWPPAAGILPSQPAPADLPCSGPQCSGRPDHAPPVTVVAPSPDLDPAVSSAHVLPPPGPRLTSRLFEPAGDHFTRRSLGVYRPPRRFAV